MGTKTVRSYIESGDLKAVRLPRGIWRVWRSSVLKLLERGQQED